MSWCRIGVVLLAICSAVQAGSDISYAKTIHFTIQAEPGPLQLRANVAVEQKYISARSTDETRFEIVEYPHTTVSDIQAVFRGKALDSKWISYYYPQSRDVFIDSSRIHEIAFPRDLRPSETISYQYRETYEDLAFFPLLHVPALNMLDRFEVIVDHPADYYVEFEVSETRGTLKSTTVRTAETRTSLRFENLPDPKILPSDPFRGRHAEVLTKVTRSGTAMTPHTPEAFTEWYLGRLRPSSLVNEEMRTLLSRELGLAQSESEKARILFDYVKSQIRYIADEGSGHAFLPHSCIEVLDKKWGDCKDKARFLSTLAQLHGIPIHMALLCTHPTPEFSEVNVGLFNHAICVLQSGEELIFMDPTAPQSEMGDPPGPDLLMKALVLDPKKPRYVQVDSRNKLPNLELSLQTGVAELGKSKAGLVLRGSWRSSALQGMTELNSKDFESYLRRKFERLLPKLGLDQFHLIREDKDAVVFEARADLSDFVVVTDQNLYVSSTPFQAVSSELLEREKDPHAVAVAGPERYRLEVKLSGPGLEAKPDQILLSGPGETRYRATSSGLPGSVKLEFAYDQPYRLVPSGARTDFLKFCSEYLQSKRRLFTIQRGKS